VQVKDLNEKLIFAHETIAIMEDDKEKWTKKVNDEISEDHDPDEVADKMSENSNPSAKMVD